MEILGISKLCDNRISYIPDNYSLPNIHLKHLKKRSDNNKKVMATVKRYLHEDTNEIMTTRYRMNQEIYIIYCTKKLLRKIGKPPKLV